MDLAAALALVLVFEGLALAIFAKALPQVLAELDGLGSDRLRLAGFIGIGIGTGSYILIRSVG